MYYGSGGYDGGGDDGRGGSMMEVGGMIEGSV